MGSQSMAGQMSQQTGPHAPPKSNSLLIVIAVGFFLLAGLLIVVLGLRYPQHKNEASGDGTTSPNVTGVAMGTGAPASSAAPTDSVALGTQPPAGDPGTPPPPATGATTASATAATTKGIRNPPPAMTQKTVTAAHPPPAPPPPAEDKDPGFLTINVYPWAKVSEGGRVLCAATPCNKIPLSPGSHTLSLENPEQGMKQSTTVVIKSGDTTTRAVGFK
jgi:serine/threonine-protein kinase